MFPRVCRCSSKVGSVCVNFGLPQGTACLGSASKDQARGMCMLLLQGHLNEAGGSLQVQQTALLPPDCLVRTGY